MRAHEKLPSKELGKCLIISVSNTVTEHQFPRNGFFQELSVASIAKTAFPDRTKTEPSAMIGSLLTDSGS